MKVSFNNNIQTNFKAEISPDLEQQARDFFMHHDSRVKHNYMLNNQIEKFKAIGYPKHIVGLVKKQVGYGMEYRLYVTKKGIPTAQGTLIFKRGTFRGIIAELLNMTPSYLASKIGKR